MRPESVGNAVSNICYGLATVPYVALALQGVLLWTTLAATAGLLLLCAGSWMYHANAGRLTNLCDHIGMHAALSAVAGFSVAYGWDLPDFGAALVAILFLAGLGSVKIWGLLSNTFDTRHSRKMIMVHAVAMLIGIIGIGLIETAMTAGIFGMAFMFHHDHEDTPTHFGPIHAAWHGVSALGLAMPAIWALNL